MSALKLYLDSQAGRRARIARVGLFSGLSIVGSFVPIPSPVSTVALDSFPGYLSALLFGPSEGFIIISLGHIATSVVHGFPLGVLHFPIALGLGCAGFLSGYVNSGGRRRFLPATVIGIVINTLLFVVAVPVLGWDSSIAFLPFLFTASSINALLAMIVYLAVRQRLKNG